MNRSHDAEVLVHRDGPIAWLVFSQPKKHNALALGMLAAVPGLLEELTSYPEVRVLILRGAGEGAFVSGADLSDLDHHRASPEKGDRFDRVFGRACQAVLDFDKPVVAMIHGHCIGGGLATALLADLRIAADDSRFGIPAAKLGVGYGFDGVQRLVDIVGPAFASEILLSARTFDADQALHMRLVNRVLPKVELESEVRTLAEEIAGNAPLTQRAAKVAIRNALRDAGDRDLSKCRRLIARCFTSEDYAEGRRAFAEKRKPVFRGR